MIKTPKRNPKNKAHWFIVKDPVYNTEIVFSMYEDRQVLVKRLLDYTYNPVKEVEKSFLGKYPGRTRMFSEGQVVVHIKAHMSIEETMDVIAHEIGHVAFMILHYAGVEFKHGVSDEAYTYYIGFLTREFYRNYPVWEYYKKKK